MNTTDLNFLGLPDGTGNSNYTSLEIFNSICIDLVYAWFKLSAALRHNAGINLVYTWFMPAHLKSRLFILQQNHDWDVGAHRFRITSLSTRVFNGHHSTSRRGSPRAHCHRDRANGGTGHPPPSPALLGLQRLTGRPVDLGHPSAGGPPRALLQRGSGWVSRAGRALASCPACNSHVITSITS
jgi:hypothetical protein